MRLLIAVIHHPFAIEELRSLGVEVIYEPEIDSDSLPKAIQNNVRFSVTGEGLRVDLMETEQGMFFVTGSPSPTPSGEALLRMLAGEIGKMPNSVVVEGHTDARPFRNVQPMQGYGNWDLSTERANAARRVLQGAGLRSDQVTEVRGFAERRLLDSTDPNNPRNRRVSLVVEFMPE